MARGIEGERERAAQDQLLLDVDEQLLPQPAQLGAVAPVAVDRGARALAATHEEEPAALASTVLLGGLLQGEVALEPGRVGLEEVDAVLVGAPAVAALSIALDPAHRLG